VPGDGKIISSAAGAEYWKNGKPFALPLKNGTGSVAAMAIVSK
jgi:hypothetical protein